MGPADRKHIQQEGVVLCNISVKNTFIEAVPVFEYDMDKSFHLKRGVSEPVLSSPPAMSMSIGAQTHPWQIDCLKKDDRVGEAANYVNGRYIRKKCPPKCETSPAYTGVSSSVNTAADSSSDTDDNEAIHAVTDQNATLHIRQCRHDPPIMHRNDVSGKHSTLQSKVEPPFSEPQIPVVVIPPDAVKPLEWAQVCTVMLQNLPNKASQQSLLSEMDRLGFQNTYDFVYLPIDMMSKSNRGYAFINFHSSDIAFLFKLYFEGRKFGNFSSDKVMSVGPAAVQGFEDNYVHYHGRHFKQRNPLARPLFLRKPDFRNTSQYRRHNLKSSVIDVAKLKKQRAGTSKQINPAECGSAKFPAQRGCTETGATIVGLAYDQGCCLGCGLAIQASVKFCSACGSPSSWSSSTEAASGHGVNYQSPGCD